MSKKLFKILSLTTISLFVGIFAYHSLVLEKEAEKIENQLYNELLEIQPPQESKLIEYKKYHKSDNALVLAKYLTTISDETIIKHYENELSKHGWSYCCDDDDEVAIEKVFNKSKYTAHIFTGL